MEEVGRGGINLFILMLFLIQVHTNSDAERICKSLRKQHAGEELQPGCHPQQRPRGRGEYRGAGSNGIDRAPVQ